MQAWDHGTRRIYEEMSADFRDRIYLDRPVRKVYRHSSGVVVEDEYGDTEMFDDVVFACNANQTLMILDKPTILESFLLSSIRYESELHNHTIVHSDASVLPDNEVKPLDTRSNHIEQYGVRPDNYEITYIMHNQQPWAKRSDRPCLVTYNPISPIDEGKVIRKWWFQHIVHDVPHIAFLVHLFRFVQGRGGPGTAEPTRWSTARRHVSRPAWSRRGRSGRTIRFRTLKQGSGSTSTGARCTAGASGKRRTARSSPGPDVRRARQPPAASRASRRSTALAWRISS